MWPDAIDSIRWTAEAIDKVYGEIAPTGEDTLGLISHEPVGVVGRYYAVELPTSDGFLEDCPGTGSG